MTTIIPEAGPTPQKGLWFDIAVILFTIAFTGLVTFISGFVIENALDGRVRDRSIWGILLIGLSIPSWLVLLFVIRRRASYSGPVPARRWLNFAKLPGVFVGVWLLVFLGYAEVATSNFRPLIPHTPVLAIRFTDQLSPSISTRGDFDTTEGGASESRFNGAITGTIPFRFRATSTSMEPKRIVIKGEVLDPNSKRRETHLELVLEQRARVQIEGLNDMLITIDGKPSNANSELAAGTYKVVIAGER